MSFWSYLKPRLVALLEFIVAWLVLMRVMTGIHEDGHSYVDQLLGHPPGTIKTIYVHGFPIGGYYVPVSWEMPHWHLVAVALAGGLTVALFFIYIDRYVHGRRGLDLALNYWWAQQLTYSIGEALYFAMLAGEWMIYAFAFLGHLMGVLCVFLEVNGVVNV